MHVKAAVLTRRISLFKLFINGVHFVSYGDNGPTKIISFKNNLKYKIISTAEFNEWYFLLPEKDKQQIRGRLSNIELDGHFGNHKSVSQDDTVWELKWNYGRRIYYTYMLRDNILLLLRGNKNGQSKDITQAKKILAKYNRL